MSNINKLYNIWVKNENLIGATYGNVSLYTQAKADLNTLTTTSLGVGCADPSINYILDVSGNQRTRGNMDISGVITSPWLDASLNARAYDASSVHLAGAETISGAKTFTGGIKFAASSIDMSNNSIVNPSAIRMYQGSIQTNGGIYFQAADLNRKLTLYPITNGECGNHSIGVNGTGTNFQFMVPDINRKYTFSYGTGASTKTDILTIDPNNLANGETGDNGLIMRNQSLGVKKSDGTPFFYMNPYTDDAFVRTSTFDVRGGDIAVMDASGATEYFRYTPSGHELRFTSTMRIYDTSINTTNLAVEYTTEAGFRVLNDVIFKGGSFSYLTADGSTNLLFGFSQQGSIESKTSRHWYTANQTVITGTYTVPKPWDEYYGIDISGSAYTITLPTITDIDAGNPITFRKISITGASYTVSFQSDGTQRLFTNSLSGSTAAVGMMTGTVYYLTMVPMWDKYQNTWGWFRVV